jgi:formate/nitrite transporter FocA (FNT family)
MTMDEVLLAFLSFMAGVALTMGLVIAAATDHKTNCDSFGMTRMAGQVYACHPKDKKGGAE